MTNPTPTPRADADTRGLRDRLQEYADAPSKLPWLGVSVRGKAQFIEDMQSLRMMLDTLPLPPEPSR